MDSERSRSHRTGRRGTYPVAQAQPSRGERYRQLRNPFEPVRVFSDDKHLAVVPVSGPPNASDLDRGRRPGSFEDFRELLMLAQSFDVIHLLGPSIEPQDVAPQFRHLDVTLAQLTPCDKIPFVYSRGRAQVEDCFAMTRMAHGISLGSGPPANERHY